MNIILPLTGFPRSGSTFLMNVLGQNPIFELGNDSEIGSILNYNKRFITSNIHHFQLPPEKVSECFYDFCREGTYAWISKLCNPQKIFLDKSRHWLNDLNYIFKVFPDIKLIVTIRDLRGIINSFEKINNNSLFVNKENFYTSIVEDLQLQRIDKILDTAHFGKNLFSIKELVNIPNNFEDKIFFCRYEDLKKDPNTLMQNLYNFLEIPFFEHDFNNVKQKPHHDNPYMPYGMHKIEEKLNKTDDIFTELRPEVSDAILEKFDWYYRRFYPGLLDQNIFDKLSIKIDGLI